MSRQHVELVLAEGSNGLILNLPLCGHIPRRITEIFVAAAQQSACTPTVFSGSVKSESY